MGNVLIIEDDKSLGKYLAKLIKEMGHKVEISPSFFVKPGEIEFKTIDLVILEALPKERISGVSSITTDDGRFLMRSVIKDILPIILYSPNPPNVIVITKAGFPAEARYAIERGVLDYIQIPSRVNGASGELGFYPEEIREKISKAVKHSFKENRASLAEVARDKIIGNSVQIVSCLEMVRLVAKSSENILITGETGTGKELFARAIHDNSDRASGPYIVLNCAAITESLAESELFGIEEKVASNVSKRDGKFKLAHGGTLFLDEVGDLPLIMQAKLLRVLQERKFFTVGGKEEIKTDFRLISATNKDLKKMLINREFREDLFYRLKTVEINIPPLRERRIDIKDLINHYIKEVSHLFDYNVRHIDPDFFEAMISYDWPGNVRELIGYLKNAVLMAQDDESLMVYHLPVHVRAKWAEIEYHKQSEAIIEDPKLIEKFLSLQNSAVPLSKAETDKIRNGGKSLEQLSRDTGPMPENTISDDVPSRKDHAMRVNREYLEKLMKSLGYNVKKAASQYGTTPSNFYKILKKANISTKPKATE